MRLAAKIALLEHLDDVLDVLAEHSLATALAPQPIGIDSAADCHRRAERQRDATREAEAIIMRERSGQSARPPFRGPRQAMQALDEFRRDGASIAVSSVWDQIDPHATGRGERPSSAVERVAIVAREWDACMAGGWVLVTSPFRSELTPHQARAVVVWAEIGIGAVDVPRALFDARSGEASRQKESKQPLAVRGRFDASFKGGFDRWHAPTHEEVATHASAEFGLPVPIGHVPSLRRTALGEFYRRLRKCELVSRNEEMERMAQTTFTPWDIEGWKELTSLVGRDEKTLRAWASREGDPLPISDVGGRVCAIREEVTGWLRREFERNRRKAG